MGGSPEPGRFSPHILPRSAGTSTHTASSHAVLRKPCRPRNTSTLPPVQTRLAGRPSSTAMVWKKLGSHNFSSCPNGSIQWIWDVLGECAQDGWDEASVGLGLISILCFAASTFPQFIKAYKTGNMDQALSLWFLLGWIGGDSCNLIGSFLADQLPLQSYTAVYYVMADLVMLTLYFYYKFRKRPSPLSAPINSMLLFLMGTACATPLLSAAGPVAAPREGFRGRALLSVEPGSKPFTRQEIIGFVIGSVSSVLYLLSRLPQIRTNVSLQQGLGGAK